MKPPLLCRLGFSIGQAHRLQRLKHRIRGWFRYHWFKLRHNPNDDEDLFFRIDWLYVYALPEKQRGAYLTKIRQLRHEAHIRELTITDAKFGVSF